MCLHTYSDGGSTYDRCARRRRHEPRTDASVDILNFKRLTYVLIDGDSFFESFLPCKIATLLLSPLNVGAHVRAPVSE